MSPVRPYFLPQPRVFPQSFDFAGPLFSYSYKSLFPQPLSFHIHTKPPGCEGAHFQFSTLRLCPLWQIPCSQNLAASLSSFCVLFCTRSLCFQELAASFAKTPGVGGSCDLSRHSFTQSVLCEGPLLLSATTGNARAVMSVGRRRKALRGER